MKLIIAYVLNHSFYSYVSQNGSTNKAGSVSLIQWSLWHRVALHTCFNYAFFQTAQSLAMSNCSYHVLVLLHVLPASHTQVFPPFMSSLGTWSHIQKCNSPQRRHSGCSFHNRTKGRGSKVGKEQKIS